MMFFSSMHPKMDNYPHKSMDNCLLVARRQTDYYPFMAQTFRDAFLEHIDSKENTVASIARSAKVSKDMLDKFRQGRTQSINVDDAIKVANYFGKNVDEFVDQARARLDDEFSRLASRLTPTERELLAQSIKAFLAARDQTQPEPAPKTEAD